MRKPLALILGLGLLAASCGGETALSTATTEPGGSTSTTAAGSTGSTAPVTTTTAATPSIEPGTLASLAEGSVEDPLMDSGWHQLEWADDAHTRLASSRSTSGDGGEADLLTVAAWDPPPAATGLAPDQVLVDVFLGSPSMDTLPSAIVLYTPGGEGFEATVVIDGASVEAALLETTDYAAAAPDGPVAVELVPTAFDLTASAVTGMVTVVDLEAGGGVAYQGEVRCDFSADPLTCVILTDDGVLRPGDEGADVEALQEDLVALGYLTGDIDGKYGPGTRAAVIAFQTDYLLTRDGRVGPNTRAVLTEVMDGTSLLLLASENGVGAWPFGTPSEDAYAGLVGALGVPDTTTGWYVDACDGADWFKARWEGFSVVFTDRSGTRRFDGWEVNDLSDLPVNLLIAGGIHGGTRWGDVDAMGADFFDDLLGQRWRIPAMGYSNGRFVNPVSNPPGSKAAIAGFGAGTGGFEDC